jgi:predicted Fe-Mo cluster-binding NifX family protein
MIANAEGTNPPNEQIAIASIPVADQVVKIVISSGIGSRPSSRLQNARIDWIS